MRTLIEASLAPTTRTAYARIHQQLALFLRRPHNVPLFPVSVSELADFLGSRFEAGCTATTLSTAASAIAHGHRDVGLPDPTSAFQIKQLLAGARRLRTSIDQRLALSMQDVMNICGVIHSLPISPVDRAAFCALIPLAFFAMLRPGELVVSATDAHTVRVQHVSIAGDALTIVIPSSKTPANEFTVHMVARPDISVCPVSAIREYSKVRGPGRSNDVFFIDGRRRPITYDLTVILRQAGRIVGLDAARLSGHCLRISGASHGAEVGLTELQIQELGRWSSSAVRRYLRRPVSLLQCAGR